MHHAPAIEHHVVRDGRVERAVIPSDALLSLVPHDVVVPAFGAVGGSAQGGCVCVQVVGVEACLIQTDKGAFGDVAEAYLVCVWGGMGV